ncbi:MAG: hypothetical protein GYA24_23450 [Candidatus Lokiarchaeota archaeon]|nr:hypothetical protein [Candidatus Lokiarchaeota archaeon]
MACLASPRLGLAWLGLACHHVMECIAMPGGVVPCRPRVAAGWRAGGLAG